MNHIDSHVLDGLELLDVGLGFFDAGTRLVHCNRRFRELRSYPEALCQPGTRLEAMIRFNAERGDFGPGDVEKQIAERLAEITSAGEREVEREMADGQILRIRYRRTPSGGQVISFIDCTAERRAEAAMAASEERYAMVSEAAEEAIYEWDIAGGRFYASPRLRALLGRELGGDGARAWNWDEIVHPGDIARYRATLERHLAGDEARWRCEYRLRDASGDWRWVSDHGTSVRQADGKAIRMVAAIRDITERVEKDAALAASEERYAMVTEATADGIYDWDVPGKRLWVSGRLARDLEFDAETEGSDGWYGRIHPDDKPGYLARAVAHLKGETGTLDAEYRARVRGGYRWMHDRGVGQRGPDGRVIRVVGAMRDITDIKEARAEIERTEGLLASSLATISDGILLVDGENRVQLWNERYFEIFSGAAKTGDTSAIIHKGRPFVDMIRDGYNMGMFKPHPKGVDAWIEARMKAWAQPASQWELELSNGTWILLNERMMPDGGRVSVYTDITELKRREKEAGESKQRFEDAIEAVSSGFALWDSSDRLVVCNRKYREYFPDLADMVTPGTAFRDIIRTGIGRGLFPKAAGDPEAFLDGVAARRAVANGDIREQHMAGGLWLQISDHRTADGGIVSIYTDVTELKTQQQQADAARNRFEEAIEAISAGFSLWDADDRLVICNSTYRELYAEFADAVQIGAHFRDVLGTAARRGLIPAAKDDPEAYIERNYRAREAGIGKMREHRLSSGRCLHVTDHRTADGGLVSVHTDVTELKNREEEIRRQTAILEATMENMGQGITMVDKDLRTLAFNRKFFELMEFPEELFGKGFSMEDAFRYNAGRGEYGPGDVEEQVRQRIELAKKFQPHRFERIRPDGTVLEIVGNPIEGGGLVATYTDITERKRADEALKAALAEFDAVLGNIDYGILFMDADLNARICNRAFRNIWNIPDGFVEANPSMRALINYNRDNNVYDVAPGDWDRWVDGRVAAIKAGEIPPGEMVRADGMVLRYQCVSLPDGGRMLTYFDITEMKRAEQVVRESEAGLQAALAEFDTVIENIDYGILFMDADLKVRIVNRAVGRIWGIPQEFVNAHPNMRELIEYNRDKGVYDVADEDWDEWLDNRVAAIRAGPVPPTEVLRADGKAVRYQCVALPDGGRMLTYFDITEMKRAEQVARASEIRLRGVLENSPIGVAVIRDTDNVILFHNARFAEVLRGPGEDLVGVQSQRFWTDLEERAKAREIFERDGRVVNREVMYRGMDGSDVWSLSTYERADWEGAPSRLIWLFDITQERANREALVVARDEARAALADLQKAQARLVQAEKMASLGQLTAGIAHEIKNPLNFVNNFAKLSDELLGELAEILEEPIKALDPEARDDAEDLLQTVRDNLAKINQHGRRADSIVKNMLLHSREGPSEQQTVALNPIAEEALNLAYHGARAENPKFNIEMKKTLDPEVGQVECFPQDIMRVFLNLITNGMYAANKRLADSGGAPPEISLTTRVNGDRVEVEVRDNGTGIPADVREKIFNPFFTTKPAGEGTGLGLSLSYDIVVKQHGGELTVESEPGEFTAFRVSLPRKLPASGAPRK